MSTSPARRVRVASDFARKPVAPIVPAIAAPFRAQYLKAAEAVSWVKDTQIESISYTKYSVTFTFVGAVEVKVSGRSVKVVEL